MQYELKISQAAELLGVTDSRVSQLISSGVLDSVTIGGKRRISKDSVKAYQATVHIGRPPKKAANGTVYTLMNGPHEIMLLRHDPRKDLPFDAVEVIDADRAPISVVTRAGSIKRRELNEWWEHRSIPHIRPGIEAKLAKIGVSDTVDLPFKNLGLSLSDCYWLRPEGMSGIEWADINYYENGFEDTGNEEQPAGWWLANVGLDSPDNTSEGELPKRWMCQDGKRILFKGCRADDQRPYNEVVATALHRRLLRAEEYVPYWLARTAEGPACACECFLNAHEEYVPACYIKAIMVNVAGSSTYDRLCRFAGRIGGDEAQVRASISKMIVCDALIANSDRHWRNFGFIRDIHTLELRPAPIFDSGNSLWFAKLASEVAVHDWSFAAMPFGPELERQLACVDTADWYEPAALDGFVDEAIEILRPSAHASQDGRLDYIAKGLERQVEKIGWIMAVMAHKRT